MVRSCPKSKHLVEGAPVGDKWLLSVQLLNGALRCLRLLWPGAEDDTPPPIALDDLLPLLAKQLCGTQHLLQSAASALLATVVAAGAADTLPDALAALTEAILTLTLTQPAAKARRREALQQVAPLLRRWLDAPRVARNLAQCVDRMQALSLLLLAEPCPKLRGEAATLMILLSPVAKASAAPPPVSLSPRLTSSALAAAAANSTPGSASLAEALEAALPSIAERALSDPLQLKLWCEFGNSDEAKDAAGRLRGAAAAGGLRAFVQACGTTEGETELWLCCVHGIVHTLARAGDGCALALRAAWPMIIERCPRVSASAAMQDVSRSWAPYVAPHLRRISDCISHSSRADAVEALAHAPASPLPAHASHLPFAPLAPKQVCFPGERVRRRCARP